MCLASVRVDAVERKERRAVAIRAIMTRSACILTYSACALTRPLRHGLAIQEAVGMKCVQQPGIPGWSHNSLLLPQNGPGS